MSPVASCSYQIGGNNILVSFLGIQYATFDNFELLGLCQNDTNAPFGADVYVKMSGVTNVTAEHLYIHGWTALAFSCSGGNGHCFNMEAFLGNIAEGDAYIQDVVDGSDSVANELAVLFDGGYQISQCVFRWASQMITTGNRILSDTLFEHWYEPGDNNAHGNLYEESGSSGNTVHAHYGNMFRHICTDSNACPLGIVGIWPQPSTGTTDYWFNNVMYDTSGISGNYFDIGQNDGAQGTEIIFNNTFEESENGPVFDFLCSYSHPFTASNNHYIDDNSPYSTGNCQGTYVTDLAMAHSTAAADGYSVNQTYAYSPTASNSPTVGTGTNQQAYCNSLTTSGLSAAAGACQSDTTYACSYDAGNHTVTCPARAVVTRPSSGAWDIGAYQFLISDPPGPPGNLTAIPQ